MHKETHKEDVGFDVVVKIEKTNSSKSLKRYSEIHIPYYDASGFLPTVLSEQDIVIDGTEEEKEIIRAKLIEKGIITEPYQSIEPDLSFANDAVDNIKKELDEEALAPLEKQKSKRGRKPKELKWKHAIIVKN